MEHRYVEEPVEGVLDLEAGGRRDVLEIDPAVLRRDGEDGVDDALPGVTADVTYTLTGADAANYIAPISEKVNAEITPAPAEGYVFAGGNVMYDGQEHTFTLSGTEEGDTVRYSLDGVTFDIVEMPAYTDAGTYTVYVKVESANYADWTGEATLKIAPREITVTGTTVDDKVYDADTAASIRLG